MPRSARCLIVESCCVARAVVNSRIRNELSLRSCNDMGSVHHNCGTTDAIEQSLTKDAIQPRNSASQARRANIYAGRSH